MSPKKKKKLSSRKENCSFVLHFPECQESSTVEINARKYERIKEIAEKRQTQPPGSAARYDEICQQIPQNFVSEIGYHR